MKMNDIISRPSEFYTKPSEILHAQALDDNQKMKALENWKQTCIQLQESTAEGMSGRSQAEELRLVSEAIRELS